jgi:hypothetical protein
VPKHGKRPIGARLARALAAFTSVTVLTLVLGQLFVLGHYVLVAHYLCAEHGTLHHGRPPTIHEHHELSPKVSAIMAGWRGEHGGHDECAFPAREHKAISPPTAPAEIEAPALVAEIEPFRTSRASATPSAVYSFAPKQSPPVVA